MHTNLPAPQRNIRGICGALRHFEVRHCLTGITINLIIPLIHVFPPPETQLFAQREEEKMLRIVSLQLMATVVAGIVAALLGGWPAMFSAMLGGLCCVVPNGLFALRLFASAQKPGGANPMTFMIGEFIKIALTVALLGAAAWLYRDLNWFALIGGFIVALKSYIILLFRR